MDVNINEATTGALQILSGALGITEDLSYQCRILSHRYNTANLLLIITIADHACVAKCASVGSYAAERLAHEVQWYEASYRLDSTNIRQHCPRYFGSCISGGTSVMLLEHIPYARTMRDAFFDGEVVVDDVILCLRRVLSLFGVHADYCTEAEQAPLRNSLYKRLLVRTGLLRSLIAGDHSIEDLWDRSISVNGLPPVSLAVVNSWLIENRRFLLHSKYKFMGATHGDLHLENILTRSGNFYLIDPNASVGSVPIYDIGKILHSVNGFYDLVHAGKVELDIRDPEEISLRFEPILLGHYKVLGSRFKILLSNIIQNPREFPLLYGQACVVSLIHFMCLLPHHFCDRRTFLALAMRTLELYHETTRELVRSGLDIHLWQQQRRQTSAY